MTDPSIQATSKPSPPPGSNAADAPIHDPDQRRRLTFIGGEDDLAPTEIHYVKSNEVRHDVWFPALAELGGIYIGVGADQNYTLIAAADSEIAFLLDIDQRVVDIHRVYEALIEAAETPDALMAWFGEGASDDAIATIERHFAEAPEADRVRYVRSYRAARETLRRHLEHVGARRADDQPSTWLSNPVWYAKIRQRFVDDRIRSMGGDLTGPTTMQTIAANARALGHPVRVLYLSNAEEYFQYTPQFRTNVQAMPGDDKSLALRTIYSDDWEHAARLWNYQLQPLADFQRRLDDESIRSRNPMLRAARRDGVVERKTETKGLSRVGFASLPAQ